MKAYEDMLGATSTKWAPWYIIPADHKWVTRACVADIITGRIEELSLAFPKVSKRDRAELEEARAELEKERWRLSHLGHDRSRRAARDRRHRRASRAGRPPLEPLRRHG